MATISRRKFLQISGLAAGASMLPMPMKWLGAGSAEAFMQSPNTIPLYGTTLRLGEIPVALPNPFATEFAANEVASAVVPGMGAAPVTFPFGFPKTGYVGGQTGAPVTGVRHYSLTLQQFVDPGVVPTLGGTTLWGYKPDLTLLEGLTALGAITATNPFFTPVGSQQARQLGGIIFAEAGPAGQPLQITMRNNLPLKSIIPNDVTVPGTSLGEDRTTVHFHGGLMPWISDGGPFDWFCSAQRPAAARRTGQSFLNNAVLNPAANANVATKYTQGEFFWNIDKQSARFCWYHDHAWGITRTNAYAGVATGLVLRDNFERGLIANGLPPLLENSLLDGVTQILEGKPSLGYWPIREYPLVFQDKIFVGNNIKLMDSTWTGPKTAGSLWYPHTYEGSRWRRAATASKLPSNSCIAEMFGDTMLVNGTASPTLTVEARRYRFRLLNACNARFLNLQLYVADGSPTGITLAQDINGNYVPTNTAYVNPVTGGSSWAVLGNECGFLETVTARPSNKPLLGADFPFKLETTTSLLLGSAFRPDVLLDFSAYAGQEIILYNDCPCPFPGGDPRNDYFPGMANGNTVNTKNLPLLAANARNTRCIMKFTVVANSNLNPDNTNLLVPGFSLKTIGTAPATNPEWNSETQTIQQSTTGTYTITESAPGVWTSINGINLTATGNAFKQMSLNEDFDAYGRLQQKLGQLADSPAGIEYINAPEGVDYVMNGVGGIEVWAIYNTTADVHPMHFHMSNWQVLGRRLFTGTAPALLPDPLDPLRGPLPEEFGFKETILCWPGEIVYIMAKWNIPQISGPSTASFDPPTSPRPGLQGYHETVWHCHILEHEEHDMMRPVLIKIVRP
jgi:spore coat protein A, manganese oxidase